MIRTHFHADSPEPARDMSKPEEKITTVGSSRQSSNEEGRPPEALGRRGSAGAELTGHSTAAKKCRRIFRTGISIRHRGL